MYAYRYPHSTSGQILIRVGHDKYVGLKKYNTHENGMKFNFRFILNFIFCSTDLVGGVVGEKEKLDILPLPFTCDSILTF